MRGLAIDRADIHKKIWDQRNRRGIVKIFQKAFAAHLGISTPQMSRIIHELMEQGRIVKIGSRYRNVGVYEVKDPANFAPPETAFRSMGVGPMGADLGEQ